MLRHGQSEWNAISRWQGAADIALTDLGRSQARRTAARLEALGMRFSAAWASDLMRADETASIIAAALGLAAVSTDPRLRESHAGEWQGLTPTEIEERYPGWLDAHRRPDTFEPFDEVVARAVAALVDIADTVSTPDRPADRSVDPVLIVSHSGLIRSVIRSKGIDDPRIPNLGGVWVTVAPPGPADESADGAVPVDADRVSVGDLFDPGDIPISGVDMPGEDPGEKSDHAHADGAGQH